MVLSVILAFWYSSFLFAGAEEGVFELIIEGVVLCRCIAEKVEEISVLVSDLRSLECFSREC